MIKIQNLHRSYEIGGEVVKVLNDISLELPTGDMMCIIGKNGSGKTTLLRLMGLLDKPTAGDVIMDGQNVADMTEGQRSQLRQARIGYIFQEQSLLPELTALENIYLPAIIQGRKQGQVQRAQQFLELVDLAAKANYRPHQLSGGQQQKVAIARALMKNPTLLLADEATSHLDPEAAASVMQTLQRLNRQQGITVAFVTNDTSEEMYAKHAVFLQHGKVLVSGTVDSGIRAK
jgi:putative ABC transport system ATP-binding protein